MEKTKFELECDHHCIKCMMDSMDICNLPGHCQEEATMARCGICGEIYCSEDSLPEINLCASCSSIISRNIDADDEIIDKHLFSIKESPKSIKGILRHPLVIFPDKSFFDVKDVLIVIAVIVLFTLSQI